MAARRARLAAQLADAPSLAERSRRLPSRCTRRRLFHRRDNLSVLGSPGDKVIAQPFPRVLLAAVLLLGSPRVSQAALSYWVDPNGWPDQARRDAAVSAAQLVVDEFNRYGEFAGGNPGQIRVVYGSGTPTADAGYGGWGGQVRFGGSWPSVYVMLHEINHWLGSGTFSNAMGLSHNGRAAVAMIEQFDGVGARIGSNGVHFWPYGHNYPDEYSYLNHRRNVALMYALRQDWGLGPSSPASSAANVHLRGDDAVGESGFNFPWNWSDDHFAQAGSHYYTGDFALRTPAGYPSWYFRGESLTVNNKNNPDGGLLFNGWGNAAVVSFKNLIVDGGVVKHDQLAQDLFQLGGKVTLAANATFNAAQGDIKILADIGGSGSLHKKGPKALALTGTGTYHGDTVISGGTLQLASVAAVANYSFDVVSGSTVVNRGTGGASMNGALVGGAAIIPGGKSGNAVSLSGGASVNINNPIVDLGSGANWTVSAWVKTATPGGSILTKGDGAGWSDGNTIFYLGDGTAGGSGGIPSSVRYAGGFFQGSTGAASAADNAWHHVAYVNSAGNYAIYVDGVAQPLSAGNAGFGNADAGSVVRLGVSTNTFASDGTVNFNGLLDSVQFYADALSDQQVEALYQGTRVFGALPSSSNVTIASGATLDLNGAAQQIGALTGPAGAAVALGGGRLTVSSAAHTQFAGNISGTGSLAKQGAGTLTLAGANTYSGATTVSGGTLLVDGSLSANVVVQDGAALGGGGAIAGVVTIQSGGALAPGNADATIAVGGLALSSASLLDFELGEVSDRIVVNGGSVALDGTLRISLLDGYSPAGGESFSLFEGSWLSLAGAFQEFQLPSLTSGLTWNTSQVSTTGILSVASAAAPADFNEDGSVNGLDLANWQAGFGGTSPTMHMQGDADGDADSDGADFLIWQRSVGAGAALAAAAVPEPCSLALTSLPLSLLAVSYRYSRRPTRQ